MVAATQVLGVLGQRAPSQPREAEKKAQSLIRAGFPVSVVARLATAYGVSKGTIEHLLDLAATTRARRQRDAKPLGLGDSDRAFRLARVFAMGEYVLEDRDKARNWFLEPNRALGGERPLDLLDNEAGTESVERLLHQIEYGVYS